MVNYDSGLNIVRLSHFLIFTVLIVFILIVGKPVLGAIAFSIVFAFMLKPVAAYIESIIKSRIWAIALAFIALALPLLGAAALFSVQFVNVISDLSNLGFDFRERIFETLDDLNEQFDLNLTLDRQFFQDNLSSFIDDPLVILQQTIATSTATITDFVLIAIYTFLLLLYRTSIKNFFLTQFGGAQRIEAARLLFDVQKVVKEYLYGLILVLGILGIMESGALWVIGIDYPFFWGFLAAFLAIVPYIGTFIGGLLPTLYALITHDSLWPAALVAIAFATIQQIEGNFITPKVVGSSVRINPLAAIVSLIIGGAIWGISGLILAIPFIAIIKVIFEHIDMFKPIGLLMDSEVYDRDQEFFDKYDQDEYRLSTYFSGGGRSTEKTTIIIDKIEDTVEEHPSV